ncbi:hypothetical protein FFLO_05046 [Filobasidium floriforme]|uniref:Aldehyde dehydrogenase domain-containing protein n=1 Tax=Filobasidium floriforme TaxID=5210 RepID=A0A8K0NLU2_9TREE|nr:aldehyde dehydrogenase [Filobasidium floriforme]KAG7530447.1 hypothetical protein FFLO_05046 [Filobasidium floriforme]KAH8078575.1 aldehyde dehydrogenase [Filobasidium floriforme]
MSSSIVPHWIANKPHRSIDSTILHHPNSGDLVHEVSNASEQDVENAIVASHEACQHWRNTTSGLRRKVLLRAAKLLEERADEFVRTWRREMDVSHHFAEFNVRTSISMIEEIAHLISSALAGELPRTADGNDVCTLVTREPYGVCLAIAPWNAAMILSIRSIATPIAAGNTVILRSSEVVPHTHYLWGQLFADAGLPAGCLNIVHADRDRAPGITKQLIEDDRVRHVNFTGSSAVGRHIGRMSGQNLKPCILELGGKAPVIILPDADLSVAANNVLFHSTLNAGQICMSTERILVPDHLVEQFTAALQEAASKSDRFSQDFHEALYSSASAHRLNGMVDEAVRKGAKVLLGGTSTPGNLGGVLDQAKYPITILGDVTRDMTIWKEETFGPLAIVASVQPKGNGEASIDDALVLAANDSSYGLAASIFSKDIGRALKIARRLETGMIRINAGTVGDDPTVVFGGFKDTGFGRFNGAEGLRSFTQSRAISFPYGGPHVLPL